MNEIQAHLIDTREQWWAALSANDRELMVECAKADAPTLPDPAVRLIITAKSPAALATHVAWEGQEGSWSLTEPGRDFLLTQALDN